MRPIALWSSAATIAALDSVIWLGVSGRVDVPVYYWTIIALHLTFPVSSFLFTALLVRDGHLRAAALFGINVAGLFALLALRLAGAHLSVSAHLGLDLLALNLYLVVVPWYGVKTTWIPRSNHRPV